MPPVRYNNQLLGLTYNEKVMFIKEIENNPVLWDVDHKKFHDSLRVAAAWKGVACKLNTEENILRTRWKNLCDIFKCELSKRYSHTSQYYTGRWKYFHKMIFLKKVYTTNEVNYDELEMDDRYPIEFIVEKDSDDQSSDELLSDKNDDCSETSSSNSRIKSKTNSSAKKIARNNIVNSKARSSDYNESKFKNYTNPEDILYDEDHDSDNSIPTKRKKSDNMNTDVMFLKSLAPYFKLLEPTRKLVMRSRIQDLLLKEIADQDSCQITKPPS